MLVVSKREKEQFVFLILFWSVVFPEKHCCSFSSFEKDEDDGKDTVRYGTTGTGSPFSITKRNGTEKVAS